MSSKPPEKTVLKIRSLYTTIIQTSVQVVQPNADIPVAKVCKPTKKKKKESKLWFWFLIITICMSCLGMMYGIWVLDHNSSKSNYKIYKNRKPFSCEMKVSNSTNCFKECSIYCFGIVIEEENCYTLYGCRDHTLEVKNNCSTYFKSSIF